MYWYTYVLDLCNVVHSVRCKIKVVINFVLQLKYTIDLIYVLCSPLNLIMISLADGLASLSSTRHLPLCVWRLAGVTVELLSRSLGYCGSGERQNHRLLVGWLCSCFQWVKSDHFWILTEGWPSHFQAPTLRNVNIEVVQMWRAWYFFPCEKY